MNENEIEQLKENFISKKKKKKIIYNKLNEEEFFKIYLKQEKIIDEDNANKFF